MDVTLDPEKAAFVNQQAKYDLNFMTQIDDPNVAQIEDFVQDTQDYHKFLQEEVSEIDKNDQSDTMSQGFDGGLPDVIQAFYGQSNFNVTKATHGLQSQTNSQFQTKRFSSSGGSVPGSKTSSGFGMHDGRIGDGVSMFLGKSRDLSNMQPAALTAMYRKDQL